MNLNNVVVNKILHKNLNNFPFTSFKKRNFSSFAKTNVSEFYKNEKFKSTKKKDSVFLKKMLLIILV
jgi:hypothetical protein